MLSSSILVIAGTAASIGFVHTVLGPDHYLPFIVISRARQWSLLKTLFISFLCGLGHVMSSIVLGFLGIALGIALFKLEAIESLRGSVAAWLLIGFGLAYFVWGLHRAIRKKPHTHSHFHKGGEKHAHTHTHEDGHIHVHDEGKKTSLTPWILFAIFVFGPCEPLIPLVMFPAAKHNISGVVVVSLAFGLTTIVTMLIIIAAASWGAKFVRLGKLERYAHALAGAMIFISGLSVQFLGL
ncbi:MAG: sulfite exporter TauE/SafE family protein [Candidatus Aminicenantes bacterium]|nr:sulfite exporter TauE/SafE family protein [Candidatus Aminicenantes bacterium]